MPVCFSVIQGAVTLLTAVSQVKKWIMFDLDNTLIDTELLAFECAAPVANRILEVKGITERYTTTKLLSEWFGQPWKVMLQELAAKHEFTISDEERKTWAKWEEDLIIAAVQREGQPTQGVEAVIEALLDNPNYRIAIVSSSSLRRMYGCLDGTGMRKYFDDRHIFSAHTSLETPTPKPAPAVYKFALESLGITADEALAIEDSRGGAIAAVGAGIDAIGYVGCINIPMMQAQLISDFEAVGAKATMRHWQEFFGLLAEIEKEDDSAVVAGDGINQAWV